MIRFWILDFGLRITRLRNADCGLKNKKELEQCED